MTIIDALNDTQSDLEIEKEKNRTVELDFTDGIEKMEINRLISEMISDLIIMKKNCSKFELITMKDMERMAFEEREAVLDEMHKEGILYNNISDTISEKCERFVAKKKGIITPEEIERFKVAETKKIVSEIILKYLNNRINYLNKIVDYYQHLIQQDLKKLRTVQKLLNNVPIDITQVTELINSSTIHEELKGIVITKANEYYELKEKERLQKEEEREAKNKLLENERLKRIASEQEEIEEEEVEEPKLFNINNYESIKPIIYKYEELFPSILLGCTLEEVFSDSDLQQVLNFSFVDIDDEIFVNSFISILARIDHLTNENEISASINLLEELCSKYELYNKFIDIINQIGDISLLPNLTEEEINIINTFKERINSLKKSSNKEMILPIIENMKITLYSIKSGTKRRESEEEKIELRGFIFFDTREENEMQIPYVLEDLDESNSKSYIDSSIEKGKMVSNGYIDFNELVNDILLLGNPEIASQPNDKMSKLVRPVYYSDGYHKIKSTQMSNASGLYRIRPRITSYLRFFDEKELFIPNTKKYDQIKNLLEHKLPGIIIDETKPFSLFINYLDAFKKKDTDSYTTVKKRQSSSKIREALKTDRDYFTDEELEIISSNIDLSLETYYKLTEINDNFNFDIISRIKKQNSKRVN